MQCLNKEQSYAVAQWHDYSAQFEDILYHKTKDGIAKITINRPHVRNAFRPQTVKEMIQALSDARYDNAIGCIILTGQGEKAFVPAVIRKFVVIMVATEMIMASIT